MIKRRHYIFPILALLVFGVGWKLPKSMLNNELNNPCNLYLYDTLLFVSDQSNGINIYSIKNPSGPVFKMNIPLEGNAGLAVKDSFIFANSYSSLLVIKMHHDTLFTILKALNSGIYGDDYYPMGVLDHHQYDGWGCMCMTSQSAGKDVATSSSGEGAGGSYATFAVIDSYLYYIDRYNGLVTMDISDPADARELSTTRVDWTIETLFPTEKYLFIGGTRGMYIYDRSDPVNPVQTGSFSHFRACDPVVVRDTVAYVTLRGGNSCGETHDALLSISIKDPAHPALLQDKTVSTPYGLAVNDTLLYVARGSSGFTLFSVANPRAMAGADSISNVQSKDFIWQGDVLYMMGFSDVRIYNVVDPKNPVQLSKIE